MSPSFDRLIELLRRDAELRSTEEPPEHVVNRAMRLLRQSRPQPPTQPSSIRRWLADLKFDSKAQPLAAAGVRAMAPAGRQLVYAAGDYELELRIVPAADDTLTVSGQLLGPCSGAGRVTLTGASEHAASLNELCEFELRALPEGTYALTVRLAEAAVEVSMLELRGS